MIFRRKKQITFLVIYAEFVCFLTVINLDIIVKNIKFKNYLPR